MQRGLSKGDPAGGDAYSPADPTMFVPGRNCWRVAEAERAAVLVDAAAYFAGLHSAMLLARRSILIVGWDFDGDIQLRPQEGPAMPRLGPFLRSLVEQRPDLEIRILVWSVAVLHAPGAPLPLLLGAAWQGHPRISVRLDTQHPLYASHHQKVVCIDDCLAFAGGIDLTVRRWDTPRHALADEHRKSPDGTFYPPVHDLQMAVDGEAARVIACLARERWQVATGEVLPVGEGPPIWPPELIADFVRVPVAISRTMPAWSDAPAVREVEAMTADAILAARTAIYIEAQYFTSRLVRRLFLDLLARDDGPEIVVVTTRKSRGLMERIFMGNNRDRLLRTLTCSRHSGRFHAYSPYVRGEHGESDVNVHAKLLIVDDRFLRVGSANLNNRSMGLDTECDLSIEARTPEERATVRRIRDSLLGEHLGVGAETVDGEVRRTRSLIRAIDSLNGGDRGARAFECGRVGPRRSVFGTRIFDPARPFEPLWFLRRRRKAVARQRADFEGKQQRASDRQGDKVVDNSEH